MFDKSLLPIFTIGWNEATRNSDFPPEFVSGKIKKKWNADEKKYSDEPECVQLESFFYALRKSKIVVTLPPDALSEKEVAELNLQADGGKDISLNFENLKIGLRFVYGNELQIVATADSLSLV